MPSARRLELGKRAALFSALPAAVSRLEAARTQGGRALQAATSPTAQGLAADELARAHKTAASALGALSQGEQLPGALTATANAYTALASAARARIPAPYAKAGRDVAGADADLRRALSSVASAADAAAVTGPKRPAASGQGKRQARARHGRGGAEEDVRRTRPDAPAAAALRRRRGLLRRAPGAPPVARA